MNLCFVTSKSVADPLVQGQHLQVLAGLNQTNICVYSLEKLDKTNHSKSTLIADTDSHFRHQVSFWNGHSTFSYWFAVLTQSIKVILEVLRGQVDVIWFRSVIAGIPIPFICFLQFVLRQKRTKIIYDPRGFVRYELSGFKGFLLNLIEQPALKLSNVCIATTAQMSLHLMNCGAKNVERISNVALVNPAYRTRRSPDFPLRVVYLSSKQRWHDSRSVIEWIRWIREAFPATKFVGIISNWDSGETSGSGLLNEFDDLHTNLSPERIGEILRDCHVGLSFVTPEIGKLLTASPVKVWDYLAAGVIPMCNWEIPEHARLTGGGSHGILVPLRVLELNDQSKRMVREKILALAYRNPSIQQIDTTSVARSLHVQVFLDELNAN